MGACIECGKITKTELEEEISSLIESLLIRKISNKEYVKSIKTAYSKNNKTEDLKIKFKEYLRPTEINNKFSSDDLQNFVGKLNDADSILFSFALLFLTKTKDNFSIERNYYEMKEIFKRKIENFNDFELINFIVRSYGNFITTEMLQIYLNSKGKGNNQEEVLFLEKCYASTNVNEYLLKFFGKMKKDFQTENFFVENLKFLQHDLFSENLKNYYLDLTKNKTEDNKNGTNFTNNSNSLNLEKEEKNYNSTEGILVGSNRNSFQNNFYKENESILPQSNFSARNTVLSNITPNNSYLKISSFIPLNTKLIKRFSNLKENDESNLLEIRKKALDIHNELRAKHSSGKLIIDEELQKFSQNWAEILASNERSTNSTMLWKGKIIGESIYEGYSNGFNMEDVINNWYEKKELFDYELNSSQQNTNEFSQIVWKRSTQIGVGFAESHNGVISVVINYFPAGNTRSDFKENVSPY